MFNIDAGEFILILILGVVMFGPEKLPNLARKAARVFVAIRDIANNAQTQLRQELGPEYSDLKIQDLNPKTFVAKHMREEIAALDEAKREITAAGQAAKRATTLPSDPTPSAKPVSAATPAEAPQRALPAGAPFDLEAT
ncbi:MAG: sec-independent translocase [Propionibacteriaceae bacterium]|nr:sec-independent translocase [Propionibacteriaceae bacterium]